MRTARCPTYPQAFATREPSANEARRHKCLRHIRTPREHGGDRRRAGWALGRLSPVAARRPIRHPGRQRTRRRHVAPPVGFASPVHARAGVARSRRHAVSRAAVFISDEGRDGGLSRIVRRTVFACRCARACGSIVCRASATGSSSSPATSDSKPTTSSSRWATTSGRASPAFAADLRSATSCSCIRSSTVTWRSSSAGDVLVVGAGNSGAEIAVETVTQSPDVAGRTRNRPRAVPRRTVWRRVSC